MRNLSAWIIAALVLTANSSLDLRAFNLQEHIFAASTPWSESAVSESATLPNGALFKAISNVQQYLDAHSLEPGPTLNGGIQLMYKISS